MIAIGIEPYHAQLRRRRSEVLKTLEHVQKQQREIDDNKEWVDKAAYVSRCRLLDSLADWYTNESMRIDDALLRIDEGNFGICRACREPILTERLDTAPDAAFCTKCQETKEIFSPYRIFRKELLP